MQSSPRIQDLLITEIFHSIQGEGTHTGLPYTFVRLTGCNLRCSYCDTTYSFKGGVKKSIPEIIKNIDSFGCKNVLLTGGEPLLQRPTPQLCKELVAMGYQVSIETHGEVSIEAVSPFARIIMDIKTPSSGMCREQFRKNVRFLKANDEIKFVIASESDYDWAKGIIATVNFPTPHLLFSPAERAANSPGKFSGIALKVLAEKILADQLPVRLQTQLHKRIWGSDQRGV